jgi:hypothetical protein
MALPSVTTLAESNGAQPWLGASPQCPGCRIPLEIDGWQLTLFNDCDTLGYCQSCSRFKAMETTREKNSDENYHRGMGW